MKNEMILRDVLTNLRGHDFEIRNYPLRGEEARLLIEAAEKVLEEEKRMEDDGK
jgi:hypothetical protein